MATVHSAARDGNLLAVAEHLRLDPSCHQHRDEFQRTPLHWAALHGHRVVVEWLLAHGASPYVHDREGLTPYGLANLGEHHDHLQSASRRALAASSWPYPQVWRWPLGRFIRTAAFLAFLLVCAIGFATVRPGALGQKWNTVEAISEPRLGLGHAGKPLTAMAGSGHTLALLNEEGDVFLLNTETRLSRRLCRGIIDLTADDQGTFWLLRTDGGIDQASPLAIGGFTLSNWLPSTNRFWTTDSFQSLDVLATDLDDSGWLIAAPGGLARYRMNRDGSQRARSWQTSSLSSFPTRSAAVMSAGVWLAGREGGVRFADRNSLEEIPARSLLSAEIATLNAGNTEPWASAVERSGKLWLYPANDTGWIGPLFADRESPKSFTAGQVRAALVHSGRLFLGTRDEGVFAYDPVLRRLQQISSKGVDRLLPMANGSVIGLGKGIQYIPATAKTEVETSTPDESVVESFDVSPDGGLCVYERERTGDRGEIRGLVPGGGGRTFVLAPNVGSSWVMNPPVVRSILPFGQELLFVTDLGAVRYDPKRKLYHDHSLSREGFLKFRHASANGKNLIAVTDSHRVFQSETQGPTDRPWNAVDLGTFQADQAVLCGSTIAAMGTEAEAPGLRAKVGDARPVTVATRRHRLTSPLSNTLPVADLSTLSDGSIRLTFAGEISNGALPIFSYTSALSDSEAQKIPWPDSVPPKQIRWQPTAGNLILRSDGSVVDGKGERLFGGSGGSPFKPGDATAIANKSTTSLLLGGPGGRISEYDWLRGKWQSLPPLPDGQTVLELGAVSGKTFARSASGLWFQAAGQNWQRLGNSMRWLMGTESQGWLVGESGTRSLGADFNPSARPDRSTASGIEAFLNRAWHVWQPDPTRGDWVAFTNTGGVGQFQSQSETWIEPTIPGFKSLAALVPTESSGIVLKTEAGLIHLTPTLRPSALSASFGTAGDTVAVVQDQIRAAQRDPQRGVLTAQGWQREQLRDTVSYASAFRVERTVESRKPEGLDVVAASASPTGIVLLSADGRVAEYDPDRGLWSILHRPEIGETLLGWSDSVPFRFVTRLEGQYRLHSIRGSVSLTFATPLPPERWAESLLPGLTDSMPPAERWFQRRVQDVEEKADSSGAKLLTSGLWKSIRAWKQESLAKPLTLRTVGEFPWSAGTGVEVRRDKSGKVEYRLRDGQNTRPLQLLPDGQFAEDRFAFLALDSGGQYWGGLLQPRQLVRLIVRNGGLARDLSVDPLPLPEGLQPESALDGQLEFRDPKRPELRWSLVANTLTESRTPRVPTLPKVPLGDSHLVFERLQEAGKPTRVQAQLELGGVKQPAWQTRAGEADRPVWMIGLDAASAGKSVLIATPAGIVVRDRETFAFLRIVPTKAPARFARDGTGEVLQVEIAGESFQWNDGLKPVQKPESVTRSLWSGPWEWRVRYQAGSGGKVESIQDSTGHKRREVAQLRVWGEPLWHFADDRVNWIGRSADGVSLSFATDDGVWPVSLDRTGLPIRGTLMLPGERVERLRCATGSTWGKFDGQNWTAVQASTLASLPGVAVPGVESELPRHAAWSGALTDGALHVVATDSPNGLAFENGQPYFDRVNGLVSVSDRLFTLSASRALIERSAVTPAVILGVFPLPADLPADWPQQISPLLEGIVLSAKQPDANTWKSWRFDTVTGQWKAIPADRVEEARSLATTGPFRWRPSDIGGPILPAPIPEKRGDLPGKSNQLPEGWWWRSGRLSWDVVHSAAALNDTTVVLATACGPMTASVAGFYTTLEKIWPAERFTQVSAARLPSGQKVGVTLSGDGPARVYFDAVSRQPAEAPPEAAVRESVVTVGFTGASIGFLPQWEQEPKERLVSKLDDAGLSTRELISGGQFVFDQATTACPVPGATNLWATVTATGLVGLWEAPGAGKPVLLKSLVPTSVANATAIRADSPSGLLLLSPPARNIRFALETRPVWVPLIAGTRPPDADSARKLFRDGATVRMDPTRLVWTRADHHLTDSQPPIPLHESGREPFSFENGGMALAVDVPRGIALRRKPAGLELALLTRGGLLRTTPGNSSGDMALSFPSVITLDNPRTASGLRYGPSGTLWMNLADGTVGKIVENEWKATFGGWLDEPWRVANRRVTFVTAGGVAVDGRRVNQSNNHWLGSPRTMGPAIDVYQSGDVLWVATRNSGVFKIHPDKFPKP